MPTKTTSSASSLVVDIQTASPVIEATLEKIASTALIKKWVKLSLNCGGLLTLRFVNRAEGKKLNEAFRGKGYATNVLTFPYESSKKKVEADLIFCLPVIQKEAKEQGNTVRAHLAHLVIHGCLHAQDFDHENATDAMKMEAHEIRLLKALGISNPYLPI
ncbi:rRNA maturation RNase YbeY [Polynucleobacter necessarius]|uniref:rRNA maturation RNase YbeY n=1 Tax=Polynucleobacter necessarius TaxID=576610 RepID=UPI000E096784|nr:rRNA maturation RNase YbeY [Polynucleobacter necessarius]